jgi:hypothetical protein
MALPAQPVIIVRRVSIGVAPVHAARSRGECVTTSARSCLELIPQHCPTMCKVAQLAEEKRVERDGGLIKWRHAARLTSKPIIL